MVSCIYSLFMYIYVDMHFEDVPSASSIAGCGDYSSFDQGRWDLYNFVISIATVYYLIPKLSCLKLLHISVAC